MNDHDTTDLEVPALRDALVVDVQTLSSTLLVLDMLETAKVRRMGFMSLAEKRERDEALVRERPDRKVQIARGMKVAASPAPGNVGVIDGLVQIRGRLNWLDMEVRELTASPTEAGVLCRYPRRPVAVTDQQLLATLVHLSAYVDDTRWLSDAQHTITDLNDLGTRLIDGEDKTRLDSPCPFCDRRTLVVFHEPGEIICGRDPHSDRYEPCACPFPECPCKTRNHRHVWYRNRGGYAQLADYLESKEQPA